MGAALLSDGGAMQKKSFYSRANYLMSKGKVKICGMFLAVLTKLVYYVELLFLYLILNDMQKLSA